MFGAIFFNSLHYMTVSLVGSDIGMAELPEELPFPPTGYPLRYPSSNCGESVGLVVEPWHCIFKNCSDDSDRHRSL